MTVKKTNGIKTQRKTKMPKTSWLLLNEFFKECNRRAVKDGVYFQLSVLDDITPLDEMGVSEVSVLKVFSDHINNSFKEIATLGRDWRGAIQVYFSLHQNGYKISISDNAPEFSPQVFAFLGHRGISTNGTVEAHRSRHIARDIYSIHRPRTRRTNTQRVYYTL